MSGQEVVIIRTGSANLASVSAAIQRLGARPRVTEDAGLVLGAPLVVLPGVGAFGAAMAHLRERGLDRAIRERVRGQRPLLAVCLGMQLLCDASDESPGIAGLGVLPGRVTRFAPTMRVPQMGWNRISPSPHGRFLRAEWMYFANSFRLGEMPAGWTGSTTDYGGAFVSALERGSLLTCQFHPELSGTAGLALMGRWLALAAATEAIPC